eukprot:c1741_g1_i2.p2 GENE.c1741_g1_i2~~c1741_g1_i2.p2  ORF type:complete len:202 (+),score=35.45 c1741_g1_i2:45-650(+)
MTAQVTANSITLRGSVEIVTEFFDYSINSILYQRGIYPPETFSTRENYGLRMYVTQDQNLQKYLSNVLAQMKEWLLQKAVQKLVLVITDLNTREVLERWVFNLETDTETALDGPGKDKSIKEIRQEIQAVIRQITASVTFLPLLDNPCTFDLLIYTDVDADVPETWEQSEPRLINNSSEVRLRSFTTKVHKVDTMVSYKVD